MTRDSVNTIGAAASYNNSFGWTRIGSFGVEARVFSNAQTPTYTYSQVDVTYTFSISPNGSDSNIFASFTFTLSASSSR